MACKDRGSLDSPYRPRRRSVRGHRLWHGMVTRPPAAEKESASESCRPRQSGTRRARSATHGQHLLRTLKTATGGGLLRGSRPVMTCRFGWCLRRPPGASQRRVSEPEGRITPGLRTGRYRASRRSRQPPSARRRSLWRGVHKPVSEGDTLHTHTSGHLKLVALTTQDARPTTTATR
jgi:hypothetical protein